MEKLKIGVLRVFKIEDFIFVAACMSIILSEDIAQLEPPYLWHSGGRIQIKMGVSVADFKRHFGDRVIVAKI